jgi:hypothetical protein
MPAENNTMAQYNMVKEAFLDALVKDNLMKQEVADRLKETYAVVVTRRSWLGRFMDKHIYSKEEADEFKIVIMRIVK